MNNDLTFGEWLRRRRRELDLTRQELAHRVGCGVTTLRKIEAGERRPSKELATLLATCLDITPEEHDKFITFARTERYPERPPPPPPTARPPDPSPVPIVTPPFRLSWPKIQPQQNQPPSLSSVSENWLS
ncbi:MAG: helix-turn-helix transcriptional regulator [Anaerolineae bacterium]|nr:helix-turn-helix transcriptional regulator [Anaerolineae bacterium]